MTATKPDAKIPFTIPEIRVLGDDLIRALTPHIGDGDRISEVLHDWLDELEPSALGLIGLAAVQSIFTSCLAHVPPSEIPEDGITYSDPQEPA